MRTYCPQMLRRCLTTYEHGHNPVEHLLEYAKVGRKNTIVLVDATTGTVSKIRFEDHDE